MSLIDIVNITMVRRYVADEAVLRAMADGGRMWRDALI